MPVKWKEVAEKNLGRGDEIQKTWFGKLDGKHGFLLLSNEKLLFVHEKGFLHKTYDLVLDLPYDKIGKITNDGKYKLELIDIEGAKHKFSAELPMSIIKESLEALKK